LSHLWRNITSFALTRVLLSNQVIEQDKIRNGCWFESQNTLRLTYALVNLKKSHPSREVHLLRLLTLELTKLVDENRLNLVVYWDVFNQGK